MTKQRHVLFITLSTMFGCMALTVPLALWFYHVPELLIYAPLLLTTVPGRNYSGFCDTVLKAVNDVRLLNLEAFARAAISLAAGTAAAPFGFHAVIAATVAAAWLGGAVAVYFIRLALRRAESAGSQPHQR